MKPMPGVASKDVKEILDCLRDGRVIRVTHERVSAS